MGTPSRLSRTTKTTKGTTRVPYQRYRTSRRGAIANQMKKDKTMSINKHVNDHNITGIIENKRVKSRRIDTHLLSSFFLIIVWVGVPYFHRPKRGQFRKTKPKRPNTLKVYTGQLDWLKTFLFRITQFSKRKFKNEDRFFLWKPLVFAPILSYKNGDRQKKRFAVNRVVLRSAGAERKCGWKYIVFGWFGLRIPPLSSEH